MRFTIAHIFLLTGMVMAMPGVRDDDKRPSNPNFDSPDDERDDGKPDGGRPGHHDPPRGLTILNTFEESKNVISGIPPPPGQCSSTSLPPTGIVEKGLTYQQCYISRQDTYATGLSLGSSLRPASGKNVLWSNPLYNGGRPGVISASAPYKTFDLLGLCYSTSSPVPVAYPQFPLKGYVVIRGYDAKRRFKGETKLFFEGERMKCVEVGGEKALRGVSEVEFEAYGAPDRYGKGIKLKTWLDDVRYVVYKGRW